MARTPLIAGNWKMNGLLGDGVVLARAIAAGASGCEMLICPPATLLHPVGQALVGTDVALGAQDCHAAVSGAHTGDVSARMLKDIGCSHVLLGHSERRQDHGECDMDVAAKAAAAHRAGLIAVICVGETQAERDGSRTTAVIRAQIDGSVPAGATAANTVIAYEPVWAIGTGRTPTADEANAVHAFVRAHLSSVLDGAALRILYGGSMKPDNAEGLLVRPDIDGGLIGGASLKAADFLAIAAVST